jgi:hypothetical protein
MLSKELSVRVPPLVGNMHGVRLWNFCFSPRACHVCRFFWEAVDIATLLSMLIKLVTIVLNVHMGSHTLVLSKLSNQIRPHNLPATIQSSTWTRTCHLSIYLHRLRGSACSKKRSDSSVCSYFLNQFVLLNLSSFGKKKKIEKNWTKLDRLSHFHLRPMHMSVPFITQTHATREQM